MDAKTMTMPNGDIINLMDEEARNILGDETLETEAQTCTGGINELKQSLDTLVTASASGYGLSINFAKLGNVKMISIMGRPSEQLNAGTQYNLCDIPSGFARSTDVVGRAIANGQKAVTYYDVRGNLYLTPSDNLVTASTISFTIIYI